ncbi:DNA glycosylase [Intrasporangium oryzae NRRL B-24470]|uniref:DNA-(apurinic or apyrimidinic site) lyase n=1 Tax=Intrasporangium oryzae NRRL B-24470 TaxID=1386089 RepID=W9G4V9_9MICO|nr:DNA-formamidopyrimidine glycosylase family protein [Intrasporangium oryzae]EWT01025.1 DNA glycosylase [Intrasporangium oryzae NRRL B-24470]
MPEGHTIHALARRLERAFVSRPVAASSPQGRFAADAAQIDGLVLESAQARGKHLVVVIGDRTLHVHLGLIGVFPVLPLSRMPLTTPVPTVRLRLVGEEHVADLRGPMICALIDDERREGIEARLGPDPIEPAADADHAAARIRRSGKTIAELLMDRSVVAGVGNVYRCEVLWRHAVDPFTPGSALGAQAWAEIWADLVHLLPLGMVFSQILTMDDQLAEAEHLVSDGRADEISRQLTGERLGTHFERRFHVYKRTGEPCHRCANPVQEGQIAGRTLYWCPACQVRH